MPRNNYFILTPERPPSPRLVSFGAPIVAQADDGSAHRRRKFTEQLNRQKVKEGRQESTFWGEFELCAVSVNHHSVIQGRVGRTLGSGSSAKFTEQLNWCNVKEKINTTKYKYLSVNAVPVNQYDGFGSFKFAVKRLSPSWVGCEESMWTCSRKQMQLYISWSNLFKFKAEMGTSKLQVEGGGSSPSISIQACHLVRICKHKNSSLWNTSNSKFEKHVEF